MRALLSVYDKEGLVELAQGLSDLGWELVASGNTAATLSEAGIAHTEVAEVTGSPEMLGGRVKTLHPKIHGGILADRSKPEHLADLEANGIDAIDLVVSNLYPFSSDPSIELIDIGGPTMVRAAAKNHEHVGIVTSPADYPAVLDELRRDGLALGGHPAPAGPGRLRPHRRLRRGHRGLARRRRPAPVRSDGATRPTPRRRRSPPSCRRRCTSPSSAPRCCATARTRTSGARATASPGTPSWWDDMVQHGGNAAVVPQPLRRRRRLAAGPRAGRRRRPGRRPWPSSSTPTRAAPPWPATSSTAYERALECDVQSRLRRASWPSGATSPPRWPTPWPPARRPTSSSPSSYAPEALEKLTGRRKATRLLLGPRPRAGRSASCAASAPACSCRTSTPSSRPAASGARSPSAAPDRGRVARPGAGLAGLRPHDLQRHRRRHRRPGGRGRRGPAVAGRGRRDRRAEGGRAGQGRRRRQRRLLPLPRRAARAGRRRRDRRGPAGRLGAGTARSSPPPTRPAWPWS